MSEIEPYKLFSIGSYDIMCRIDGYEWAFWGVVFVVLSVAMYFVV